MSRGWAGGIYDKIWGMSNGSTGWNRSRQSAECEVRSAKRSHGAWCLVLGAFCLVIGLGVWLLWPEGERGEVAATSERGRIKEAKPAKARSAEREVRSAKKPKPKTVEEAMANIEEKPKPEIKKRELSPEEWNRLTNRVFKTGTEQLMSWICQITPGDMPMPIPNLDEEEKRNLAAILISKNPVKEGDSERLANLKQDVDYAKKEMAKYIGEGGDPDDFLQYYFKELKHAFEYRNEVVSQIGELYESGEKELAREFRKKANEMLTEKGIKTVDLSEFEEEAEESAENGVPSAE